MVATPKVNISDVSTMRRFVKSFSTKSLLPILMTEACVEAGRTYNAYKRGGFTEARERITEEFTSAVIWMSGVPVFDKIIDKLVGDKILNLPAGGKFAVGEDAARNPVFNYINNNLFIDKEATKKAGKTVYKSTEKIQDMLGKYRLGKLVTSLALATAMVGIAVPKMNQAITRHLKKKEVTEEKPKQPQIQNDVQYSNKMESFLSRGSNKDVAFTGLNGAKLMGVVNAFETTPKYQLLTEDGGVLAGRTGNARTKYEGIEIAFRDGTSCYFYMFNTPVMAIALNKILGGSKIDPVASEAATKHLVAMLDNGEMTPEQFMKEALGDSANIFKKSPELERAIRENGGRIEFEKLVEMVPELKGKEAEIKRMSELQPKMFIQGAEDAKPVAKSILTRKQVDDLFTGGKVHSADFLHDQYAMNTEEDMLKEWWRKLFHKSKPAPTPGYLDELNYVKLSDLEESQKHVEDFVKDIVNTAKKKGQNITKELIESANKKVLYKQAFCWGTAFATSILFLSMLIPKAQYWITRKLTGSDAFPGTAEYDKKA